MPFYEYEHIPGIDYLGRDISDDVGSKQLGSACEQLGKKKALSEMFGCCGWDVTPLELKRIAERQYVNGVNVMCQHLMLTQCAARESAITLPITLIIYLGRAIWLSLTNISIT